MSPFSSSQARHVTESFEGLSGSVTVRKNGELVGVNESVDGGLFFLPPEAATYEITSTASRDVTWSPIDSRVDARWKVTAGPDENGRLPLLALRIAGDVNQFGQAPADEPFRLDLTAERVAGKTPTVTDLDVEVSFDDGTSWQAVEVRAGRGGFSTRVPRPPAGAAFVSVRASVRDNDGGELDQTVIRAYELDR